MSEIKKMKKQYDHVLVGYNLASLTYAYRLEKKGLDYCIIDSNHISIQPFKNLTSLEHSVYTRVPFVPVTENFKTSSTLNDIIGTQQTLEGTPLTFDKGDFKSFLGFGDTKIKELDAVSNYLSTENAQFANQPEKLWNEMSETVQENIFLDQQVTDIEFENKSVTQLILNGKTKLSANNFVFFSYFPFLFETVGSEIKTLASKFAKVKWWSSASLIIHHLEEPETFELDQVYLLKGSKEQPCLGMFSRVNGELISRWESFFSVELTRDSETTGTILKEIKKQVKRAFNTPSDKKFPEHILLHDSIYGDFSTTGFENGKLPNFNNLQACSHLFTGQASWYAQVLAAWELNIPEKVQENSADPAIVVAAPSAP